MALLVWVSVVEAKLLERLQYDLGFALVAARGVLDRTPISPSWQQRLLGPLAVRALERLTGDGAVALVVFLAALLVMANLLLFAIARRRGASLKSSVLVVVCFALASLLIVYKLEYPWDAIDVIVFLVFGHLAATGAPALYATPLVVLGVFNHETVLYVPLWYLLGPLDRNEARRPVAFGAISFGVAAGAIWAQRRALYLGRPDLPGQVFEEALPLIDNHFHVLHNLRALFLSNWVAGRGWISVGLLAVVALLVRAVARPAQRRAAVWTLLVLVTIVCFGYVNETRHYLAPLAFWFAYAAPHDASPIPVGEAGSVT